MVLCPECETDLDIDAEDLDEGEVVSCPECGTDFEVVTTEPLELAPVGEDDDDDDEDAVSDDEDDDE
jgi:alpha-aminoadipate carrier protein LysW